MTSREGGWASIPALAAATAERYGDRPAIVDGEVELTYAELAEEARTFAGALVASGIEPGDRVAIGSFNSVECCESSPAYTRNKVV